MPREKRAGWVSCTGGCYDCGAEWTARNAQGLAAIHHDKTGHSTYVEKVLAITYGAMPGQPPLEGFDGVTGGAAAV